MNICETYSLIELKHQELLLGKKQVFAQHPIVLCVNYFSDNPSYEYKVEWDVFECLSYLETPGMWLFSKQTVNSYLKIEFFLSKD